MAYGMQYHPHLKKMVPVEDGYQLVLNPETGSYAAVAIPGYEPSGPALADLKKLVHDDIERQLQSRLKSGYQRDFGALQAALQDGSTGNAGLQTLQTRNAEDRSNWGDLDGQCIKLIAVGAGSTAVGIRTEANATLPLTAAQVSQLLSDMFQNGFEKMQRSWALKNALAQAADADAIEAVRADIENGWPTDGQAFPAAE